MQESKREAELEYIPPPSISKEFTDEFNRLVPEAPCGNGVKFLRYVWGCDRLEYMGEHGFERRYGDIINDPPKYVGRPQWVLEGWQSPDVYDREEWRKLEHILGEWPANGVWDFIEYHQDWEGNYLPLDNSALERVRTWKWWRGQDRKKSIEKFLEKKQLRWELQENRRKEKAKVVSERFGVEAAKLMEHDKNAVYSLPGYKQTDSGIIVPV